MMQRTHDLAAVSLVSYRFLAFPPGSINWETLLGIGIFTILGAVIPDIDNVASPAWKHKLLPWEGKATRDFLQGHRNISHSLIGLLLFTFLLGILIQLVPLPNLNFGLLQQAFFLGYLSHLITDSLTIQGVPWLYPLPFKFGFPPLSFLRIKTGGVLENVVVFPAILVFTIWMYIQYHENVVFLLKNINI